VDGGIQATLPQHEEGVLTASVQGYVGRTPYVWVGNWGMLGLVGLMLGVAWWAGYRGVSETVRPE